MSRLNSKLVLKALPETPDYDESYEIVKATNTLNYGRPGDIINRKAVDNILRSAEGRGARGTLTVEFVS